MTLPQLKGTNWPFADSPNVAVFTVDAVLEGVTILYVSHDEKDGAWQFVDGGEVSYARVCVVSLAEILYLDPSVAGLADLPLGWRATRIGPDQAWVRESEPQT